MKRGNTPEESLENTINTMATLLGGTPNCPLILVGALKVEATAISQLHVNLAHLPQIFG